METCASIAAKATENIITPDENFHMERERCAYKKCNALASSIAMHPMVGGLCTKIALGGKP